MREKLIAISGQCIMTADKVTLRLNAVLSYRIVDVRKVAETATMRSQLNTAKLIEQNPTLMRLRELEFFEKITEKANLKIIVGDGQAYCKLIYLRPGGPTTPEFIFQTH